MERVLEMEKSIKKILVILICLLCILALAIYVPEVMRIGVYFSIIGVLAYLSSSRGEKIKSLEERIRIIEEKIEKNE